MTVFFLMAVVLMVMPLVASFNDVLTRIVIGLDYYKVIQNVIVPWEVRMVGVLLCSCLLVQCTT